MRYRQFFIVQILEISLIALFYFCLVRDFTIELVEVDRVAEQSQLTSTLQCNVKTCRL